MLLSPYSKKAAGFSALWKINIFIIVLVITIRNKGKKPDRIDRETQRKIVFDGSAH
jgi:hypothetical protein